MLWRTPIVLAVDDGTSLLDVVIWGFAVVFWLVLQFKAARKKQNRPRAPQPAADPAQQDLLDVFRRLGADIPGTPPPPVAAPATAAKPLPAPARPSFTARSRPPQTARAAFRKAAPPTPARAPAAHPVRERAAAILAADAIGDFAGEGLATRADDAPAIAAATRHSQLILPRLHAMDLRLLRLPAIALPGADRTHQTGKPFRMRLHARREIRDALVVQNILRPAKGFAP